MQVENKKSTYSKKNSPKYTWVCECCGREHDKLPFPAACACSNWCEAYFRMKDIHDMQDDEAGRPLLGVIYAPKVIKERNERLREKYPQLVTIPGTGSETIEIVYSTMTKIQLRSFLKEKGSGLANKRAKISELVAECKRIEKIDSLW